MPRMVYCVKLGRELPGLQKPPMPGALGQRIYEQISQQAWNLWSEQRVLLINHYNLNMGDPEARKILREQMEEFFFGADAAQMPPGWSPEGADAGVEEAAASSSKGGGGGAAASSKGGGGGGGAARRK